MDAFELIIRFVSSNTIMTYDRNFVTYQRCNWTRLNEWRHRTIMIGLFFKYFLFFQTSSAHLNLHSNQISFCGILLNKQLFYFPPSCWICLFLILLNFCFLVIQSSGTFDKPWKLWTQHFFYDSFRKPAIFSVKARAKCLLSLSQ